MNEYGLVGFPLKHSFSQKFFTEKFKAEKLTQNTLIFELPSVEEVIKVIADNANLKGFNVTIPYKQAILPFIDALSDEAKEIGAINVVQIRRGEGGVNGSDLSLKGFNTDVYGFKNSLTPILNGRNKALVLGTGGASKAVVFALKQLGIFYKYVSRVKGQDILSYSDIDRDIMSEYKLIINCTPLGTFPDIDVCPDIPYEYLTEQHLLYDLVYNPSETLFLKKGKEKNATIKNGYEMLELQALEAWQIWTK